MKKNISISGLTKDQRQKELEKVKKKYVKKGYDFIEYIDNGMTKSIAIFNVDELILKKEQSKKIINFSLVFLVIALVLYMQSSNTNTSYEINKDLPTLSVSNYTFTFKNKPAVSISIGTSKSDYISITINRDNIYEGFQTTNKDDISINASWEKELYFKNQKSIVSLKIEKIDRLNKEAVIHIKSKLYTNKDDIKELELDTKTTIKDINFTNLLLTK